MEQGSEHSGLGEKLLQKSNGDELGRGKLRLGSLGLASFPLGMATTFSLRACLKPAIQSSCPLPDT